MRDCGCVILTEGGLVQTEVLSTDGKLEVDVGEDSETGLRRDRGPVNVYDDDLEVGRSFGGPMHTWKDEGVRHGPLGDSNVDLP